MKDLKKNFILGVGITNAKEEEVLEYIYTGLLKETQKYYVVTPNPELLVMASKDEHYRNVLNNARIALPDGVGVIIASYLVASPFRQRITGVDLLESLCKRVSKQPITVGFLGGGPNVAELTAECLKRKYPGLNVSMAQQEWNDGAKHPKIDILFVAFGSPKQEIWISDHIEDLPVKIVMGVGGAFDFISGRIPRAPRFLRALGLEWLFRLIIQPWRITRQLSILSFIFLVLKQTFLQKKTSSS